LPGARTHGDDAPVSRTLRVSRVAALVLAGAGLAGTVVVGALALSWGNPFGLAVFLAPYVLLPATGWRRARAAGLGRLAGLELLAGTGWLALGITLACMEVRFPIRTAGANLHGPGFSGGEQNAVLFAWLHLVLYAVALRLAARHPRARREPAARARTKPAAP
jgi:hypothetical protein